MLDAEVHFPRISLVVPGLHYPISMTMSPTRILVGTDFSPGSDEALVRAIDLAKGTGATVELLYVLEPELEEFPFGLSYYGGHGDVIAHIDQALSESAGLVSAAGLACNSKMIQGVAATEIVKHARDIGADMVVVGTPPDGVPS